MNAQEARQALVAAAKISEQGNKNRPLTRSFAFAIGSVLSASEPKWWPQVHEAWKGRFFFSVDSALWLIMTAMHDDALARHELARDLAGQLPSCGGTPTPQLPKLAIEYLQGPSPNFVANVSRRRPRPWVPAAGCAWPAYAKMFFQRRELPFHVVEFPSPGGLGACADLLALTRTSDHNLVEARIALDEDPLDPRDDTAVRWLVASHLPDELSEIRALSLMAQFARSLFKDDKNLVQFAACPFELAPAWIAKNVPVQEDVGLLITMGAAMQELPRPKLQPWGESLDKLLAAWGDRALAVQFANRLADGSAGVFLYRRKGDRMTSFRAETFRLGGDPAKRLIRDDAGAKAFLA